ncbi:toxin-antitoxin system toxin component, PIN family [Fusobacterium sp. CM21]|nr:toxin-antitoxin system toxin component, PIN family [Fusobacterium sp. CM21]
MVLYAVIDTNVLVSALLSGHKDAATVQVLAKLFSNEVIPLFNREILDEYNEVLRRKKFKFSEDMVSTLIDVIEKIGEMVVPNPSGEILIDMKDLPFYEVVLSKQDEGLYLLTGNMKHFPSKPFIVTANKFLEILNKSKK